MGDIMGDSITNTLQIEDNGIHLDVHTKKYYPYDSGS